MAQTLHRRVFRSNCWQQPQSRPIPHLCTPRWSSAWGPNHVPFSAQVREFLQNPYKAIQRFLQLLGRRSNSLTQTMDLLTECIIYIPFKYYSSTCWKDCHLHNIPGESYLSHSSYVGRPAPSNRPPSPNPRSFRRSLGPPQPEPGDEGARSGSFSKSISNL